MVPCEREYLLSYLKANKVLVFYLNSQFSYGTSDLELENRRDLYPNFFRTKTSPTSLDVPRIKFIKEYGWDEVGIIYGDSERYFQVNMQKLCP